MSTRRGASTQVASSLPFDIIGTSLRKTNIQDAVEELRKQTVYDPEYYTTSASGTLTLTNENSSLLFLTGTASLYSVQLPEATTLFNGQYYVVVNNSSKEIAIRNNSGTLLASLLAESIGQVYLQSNSTSDGFWQVISVSGAATGILSYAVSSDTPFTTNSTTNVQITGFTVTPVAGRYAAFYSSDLVIVTNNRLAYATLYIDTTAQSNTQRVVQGVGSNFSSSHNTIGILNVNGSQAVSVYVRSSGGNIRTEERSLILIRLGPQVI